MFADGTGITEIALTLQRTEPAVGQQIERLDLYDRKTRPQRRKSEKSLIWKIPKAAIEEYIRESAKLNRA